MSEENQTEKKKTKKSYVWFMLGGGAVLFLIGIVLLIILMINIFSNPTDSATTTTPTQNSMEALQTKVAGSIQKTFAFNATLAAQAELDAQATALAQVPPTSPPQIAIPQDSPLNPMTPQMMIPTSIIPTGAPVTPTPTLYACQALFKTEGVVRTGPGTTYDRSGSFPAGFSVDIVGRDSTSTWAAFILEPSSGTYAWVHKDLINFQWKTCSPPIK